MNFVLLVLALSFFAAPPIKILTADLKPETLAGYERYVQTTEVRMTKEEADPNAFLYFDQLTPPQRDQIIDSLKHGQIFIKRWTTLDRSGRPIEAPGGLIHHWLGIVFIPGVSLRRVLDTVQDYDHEQDYYHPQVTRSRMISHEGNTFKVYLRLQEKKIITVILDTDHQVRYTRLDASHWSSRSYSTRIQEVENADQPDAHLMPMGHDGGFLWRINSYWRFEQSAGGVYVQCESISLTRDIPTGFGWLVTPFVTSIPKESLENTLTATRSAVLARLPKGST